MDAEDDERGGEEAEQAGERRDRGGAGRGGGRRERGGRRWRREGSGDSAASDTRGALRRGAGHHAQERAGQRLWRHLLRRPHRLQVKPVSLSSALLPWLRAVTCLGFHGFHEQVFGVRQWSLRGVLPLLGVLRRRATPHDAVPFVDSLLLRPGKHSNPTLSSTHQHGTILSVAESLSIFFLVSLILFISTPQSFKGNQKLISKIALKEKKNRGNDILQTNNKLKHQLSNLKDQFISSNLDD